jgi:hypothetical protein
MKAMETPRSSHAIAKRVGISHASYERSKKIIKKGSEDQKIALRRSGKPLAEQAMQSKYEIVVTITMK